MKFFLLGQIENIFLGQRNNFFQCCKNVTRPLKRSILPIFCSIFFSTVDLWKTKIDASHNYWNYNTTLAVGGRIRDRAGILIMGILELREIH